MPSILCDYFYHKYQWTINDSCATPPTEPSYTTWHNSHIYNQQWQQPLTSTLPRQLSTPTQRALQLRLHMESTPTTRNYDSSLYRRSWPLSNLNILTLWWYHFYIYWGTLQDQIVYNHQTGGGEGACEGEREGRGGMTTVTWHGHLTIDCQNVHHVRDHARDRG